MNSLMSKPLTGLKIGEMYYLIAFSRSGKSQILLDQIEKQTRKDEDSPDGYH